VGTRCNDSAKHLCLQKLALSLPTSGSPSVGIVRLQTNATEFLFFFACFASLLSDLPCAETPSVSYAVLGHGPSGFVALPLVLETCPTSFFLHGKVEEIKWLVSRDVWRRPLVLSSWYLCLRRELLTGRKYEELRHKLVCTTNIRIYLSHCSSVLFVLSLQIEMLALSTDMHQISFVYTVRVFYGIFALIK
jgi:hypothetical protein